jgi:hypothetical protein
VRENGPAFKSTVLFDEGGKYISPPEGRALSENGFTETIETEFLTVGTRVDVRNRTFGTWSRGFQVAVVVEGGYLIRRLSDRYLLPTCFSPAEVRPA